MQKIKTTILLLLTTLILNANTRGNRLSTTESKTYDAMDNLLSQTNAEAETTTYEYDDADRLTQTTYTK